MRPWLRVFAFLGLIAVACGDVVTKDLGDEALQDVDGIIQETEGITVEEYTDDGNQPVAPENQEPVDPKQGEKRGRRIPHRRDPTSQPIGSLHKLVIDPEALSVTSFIFNPTMTHAPWVDRIFGSKAVYHNRTSGNSALNREPLSQTELLARTAIFRKQFTLPISALQPSCSIEMLGFGRLEVDHPLKENAKHGNFPQVGKESKPATTFHPRVLTSPLFFTSRSDPRQAKPIFLLTESTQRGTATTAPSMRIGALKLKTQSPTFGLCCSTALRQGRPRHAKKCASW